MLENQYKINREKPKAHRKINNTLYRSKIKTIGRKLEALYLYAPRIDVAIILPGKNEPYS